MGRQVSDIEREFMTAFSSASADLLRRRASYEDAVAAMEHLRDQFLLRDDVSVVDREQIVRAVAEERVFLAMRGGQTFEVCLGLINGLSWQRQPSRATFDLALCGHFVNGGGGEVAVGRLKDLVRELEDLVLKSGAGAAELRRARALLERAQAT